MNKLLREGLLIDINNGYKLPKEYDDLAVTCVDTLAVTLSISKRTVEREISFLRNNGFIRKEGKKNKGFWVVLK